MLRFSNRKALVALAVSLLVAQTGVTLAQGSAQQVNEQIIVNGSDTILKTTLLSGHPFHPVTQYSVSRTVSYAGLNLATPSGMDSFWNRVNATAKDLCGELDKVTQASMSEDHDCINTATANAIQTVTSTLAASLEQKQKVARLQ